jgi:hypothetical protein
MGEWLFGPSGLVDRPELGDHSSRQIVRALTTITAEPAKSQPSTASMTSPFC